MSENKKEGYRVRVYYNTPAGISEVVVIADEVEPGSSGTLLHFTKNGERVGRAHGFVAWNKEKVRVS